MNRSVFDILRVYGGNPYRRELKLRLVICCFSKQVVRSHKKIQAYTIG